MITNRFIVVPTFGILKYISSIYCSSDYTRPYFAETKHYLFTLTTDHPNYMHVSVSYFPIFP